MVTRLFTSSACLAVLAVTACTHNAAPVEPEIIAPSVSAATSLASCGGPIIIGHRGASGYRPEHTASSYKLAIEQGADYIEPDLVMTRDGVLVARHENEISRTTDVASRPEFADRKATRRIDGEAFTGWFVEDFTLAELKTLRARERRPDVRTVSASHDGEEPILTLQEIIDIAKEGGTKQDREIGLYIELKNPGYHASIGLPMEQALIDVLDANGLNTADAPVYIQSFWPEALVSLHQMTPVKLTFLVNSVAPPQELLDANGLSSWSEVYQPERLAWLSSFANAIGPETGLVFERDEAGEYGGVTDFVRNAHEAGLCVHVWSVNADNVELPPSLRRGTLGLAGFEGQLGAADILFDRLFSVGIDGVFSDQPDIGVEARSKAMK